MSPGDEAHAAELAAIAHGLLLPVQRGGEGQDYTLFTDSLAAIRRIMDDTPGPGQEIVEAIRLARRLEAQGNRITVRWVPAHRGLEGTSRQTSEPGRWRPAPRER